MYAGGELLLAKVYHLLGFLPLPKIERRGLEILRGMTDLAEIFLGFGGLEDREVRRSTARRSEAQSLSLMHGSTVARVLGKGVVIAST